MKKLLLFAGVFLLSLAIANAQKHSAGSAINQVENFKKCSTMERLAKKKALDPTLELQMQQVEELAQKWIANHPDGLSSKDVITIPMVFHIVYNNSTENLSDARIQEQLDASNADYAGLNTHPMGVFNASLKCNTGIQFCLAQKDPSGNPTTGIDRVSTTHGTFEAEDGSERFTSSGGVDGWDPNRYINVWVVDLGATHGGYSDFPTTILPSSYGITVNYRFTGITGATPPANLGGVLTHEMAHCFNVYHVWGDDGGLCTGSDLCADTPDQADMTPGPHTGLYTDACSPSTPGIMYMNFMDYSPDATIANFTPHQSARMHAMFAEGSPLYDLANSDACTSGAAAPVANFAADKKFLIVGSTVTFTDRSWNTPTSWSWSLTPSSGFSYTGGTSATSQNPQINFTTAGTYTIALTATNGTGNNTKTMNSYIVVYAAGTALCDTLNYPIPGRTELFFGESASAGYLSGNNSYGDLAKAEKFTNYSPYTKITGALIHFAIANHGGSTSNITIRVYNNGGSGGAPGTVIGTATIPFNDIVNDINNQELTYVQFSSPITITGPFYIAVVLPTANGDEIAILTNSDNDTYPGTGWEQFSDNSWYPYSDADSWGIHLANCIYAITCTDGVIPGINESSLENIQIYPNPANDVLNIDLASYLNYKVNVNIFNSIGQLITSVENNNVSPVVKIDLSDVKSGVYYVNIKTESGTITKKISIMK